MYKKILSLCLVLLMALSCFAVSVSAYTPSLESVFENAFIWYNKEKGSTVDEESLYIRRIGSAGKYDVYRAYFGEIIPLESQQIIGGYIFTYGSLVGDEETNPTGLYAFNGPELMPLKEAYDKGLVDLDMLYEESVPKDGIIPLGEDDELQLKCKTAYIKQYGLTGEMAQYSSVPFAIQYENYAVFRVYPHILLPMESFQCIDGYLFWEGNIIGTDNNPTGIYTLDNYGNVQSLYETVNESFIDLDEIFPTLSEVAPMYISGDIDNDKKLTVKDATVIQKYLAKIPEALEVVYNHKAGGCVMEADQPWAMKMFDGTSEVNIKDATYIQKKVAKIIHEENMPPFDYNNVLVYLEGENTKEYTLEDFPEYEFDGIKRWDSQYLDLSIITLSLKNPSKSNVIDAVNSLKYREGTEFSEVTAEYIPTSD